MALIIRNARVVSLAYGPRPRKGEVMGELTIHERADVHIDGARITKVTAKKPLTGGKPPAPSTVRDGDTEIDAAGRVLMPAFIDCHTHACWAGSRLDEWDQKRRGVAYLKILEKGGGIMSTVRAVREASLQTLTELLLERLHEMLALGSMTIEVKSGYGLTTEAELKMLRAVREAQSLFPGTLVPTALLGHAIDKEQAGFVGRVIRETLPAVVGEFPGIAVDAFCEQGAWSVEQCVLFFTRARDMGLPIRVHADQFNSLGMIPAALRLGARSVDHLEATSKDDYIALAASTAQGVMLPACGFHIDGRYARGRKFISEGGAVSIATNLNPGSAPCASMPFVIALAVRALGLTPHEAITAATVNPAAVLGLTDRGTIAPGQRADLLLLKDTDERSLAYGFGGNPIHTRICAGKVL